MAGSWGTKVEAAFNQSPLLAGCPEEPAEERLGGGGARGEHGREVAVDEGLPVTNWDSPRTPPSPHTKGTANAPSARILPGQL